MPRIDDIKVQEKIFKKKEYRSWDGNLIEKLTLKNIDHENTIEKETKNNIDQNTNEPNEKNDQEMADNDESIRVQLGFNKGSDRVQLGFNKGSDRVQLGFNKGSDRVQLGFNKGSDRVQLGFNKGSDPDDLSSYSDSSCQDSDTEIIQKMISKLSGNEEKIFKYITNICLKNESNSTGELRGDDLNKSMLMTRNSRETAIKRLSKKGLIQRVKGKRGLNGTLCFYLTDLIKSEARSHINNLIYEKDLEKNETDIRVQLGFNSTPYSSSNITTTTRKEDMPDEWLEINIEPLTSFGFSISQIKQLHRLNITTPELIQDSIHHFAFGLKNNPKFKEYSKDGKNPLNVLMGVLRRGESWEEPQYRSPKEIAMEKFVARKMAEQERIKQLEDETFKIALDDWKKSLAQEKFDEIILEMGGNSDIRPQSVKLSSYFRNNVWPKMKKSYLPE